MAINDTDKLLVNDGSKTETITFSQFKDGTVLNDSDQFLINDGTKTETITWAEIEDELGPKGVVNTPTVLKPDDGAGSGDLTYAKTDKITKVEGGGIKTCETDAIESVDPINYSDDLKDVTVGCTVTGAADAFNGSTTGSSRIQNVVGDGTEKQYTFGFENLPGGGVKASNKLELNITSQAPGSPDYDGKNTVIFKYQINNGAVIEAPAVGIKNWIEVAGMSGVLITSLTIIGSITGSTSAVAQLSAVRVDGEILTNGDIVLTFPSSNGFDCFAPGDVVQQDYPSFKEITGTINTGSWEGMFDGGAGFANFTADPVLIRFNADLPPANYAPRISLGDDETEGRIRLYDASKLKYVEWNSAEDSIPNNTAVTLTAKAVPFTVVYFEFTSTKDKTSYAIFKDGIEQVIPPGEIFKVISKTDEAPWQIVVDGGKWKGTDDSGEQGQNTGNPAWNETRMWSEEIKVPNLKTGQDIKLLFDGSLTSGIGSNNIGDGSIFEILIPGDIPGSTISAQPAQPVYGMNFSVDGVNYVNKGETLELPEGDRILYIKGIGANTATCGAIYIDGLILVDALIAPGQEKLTKKTPYDTTLTVDGPTDLADMTGSVFMSDGEPAGGKYSLTGYKLVTTDIESVDSISYSSQPTSGTPYDNTLTWASAFSSPLDVNGAAATVDDTFYSIDLSAFPIAVQKGNTVKVYCLSSAGATDDNIQINENLLSSYNPILTDDQWGGASTFAYTFTASQDITVIGCAVKGPMRFCGLELNGQLVYDGQITLTFPGAVSTNPDLQYFKAGDVVQGFDEEPLTSYTLWNSIDETMMDRLSDSPTDDTGSQESLWKPNVSFNSFINGDKVWSGSPETINPGDAPSAHNPRHANFYDMGKPVNHLEWGSTCW